jgi:hypothetical protein
LHIASEIYHGGGHTPLMSHLLSNLSCNSDVLITRNQKASSCSDILQFPVEKIKTLNAVNLVDKIIEIANIAISYKSIILHIHPDDLICAVALRLVKKNKPIIYLIDFSTFL